MKSMHKMSLAICLTAAAMSSACKGSRADASRSDEQPARNVKTATVTTGDLVETVEVIGELKGIDEVRVLPQVAERIRSIEVNEGDVVKAGATLVVLEGQLQNEAVRQADAAKEASMANRDALHDDVERVRALVNAGSASRQQLDGLEARLRAADAQVRQLEAALSQASTQRSRTLLRSPIAGTVAQINAQEGDLASPAVPILTVVRCDHVKAVLRVPERQFLKIELGMPVHLAPLARPDRGIDAKVSVLGPVIDRTSRTGLVEVDLDNTQAALVPGSAVRAVIEVARRKDIVLVPARAILFTPDTDTTGEATAFVVNDGLAEQRTVHIGARQHDDFEIKDGLKPEEQLIVVGAHLLRDKSPVKVLADAKTVP